MTGVFVVEILDIESRLAERVFATYEEADRWGKAREESGTAPYGYEIRELPIGEIEPYDGPYWEGYWSCFCHYDQPPSKNDPDHYGFIRKWWPEEGYPQSGTPQEELRTPPAAEVKRMSSPSGLHVLEVVVQGVDRDAVEHLLTEKIQELQGIHGGPDDWWRNFKEASEADRQRRSP